MPRLKLKTRPFSHFGNRKQNLQFSPPACCSAVVEVIDHEEGVGLEPLDVVQVVADGARERRLADLLELLLGEPTAWVCLR